MTGVDYRPDWFAETIRKHTQVAMAAALHNGHVRIERKGLPEITVAPIAANRIDTATVETVLDGGRPTAIVLIPKDSHYDWPARELAQDSGSTIHTVKEIYGAMVLTDPRPYVDKNVAYARDRLRQHSRVRSVGMICEASMRIERHGGLDDVVAAVEYAYEFTEEALVRALSRHPSAQAILNANPNGSPTTAALNHARHAGVSLVKIGELMSDLNRGDIPS